jgi:hypothetical protein
MRKHVASLLLVHHHCVTGRYNYPHARAVLGHASYSQDLEDFALYEQFFYNTLKGKFVEIGAHDGRTLSNSFVFEKALNWSGVLIEANPVTCRGLFHNNERPLSTKLCTGISKNYSFLTFEDGRYSATFHTVSPETKRFGNHHRRYQGSKSVLSSYVPASLAFQFRSTQTNERLTKLVPYEL